MLVIPEAVLTTAEEAIKHYDAAGLKPILIGPAKEGDRSSGKIPIAKRWQNYAGRDETLGDLSRLRFEPNVGIILGEQQTGEYVVAVDVDNEARFDEVVAELGPLPETVESSTGRGRHLFLELPGEIPRDRLKNVIGYDRKPGLDVKVKGGQVVVAPSLHWSGKRYAWKRWGAVAVLPMAWALGLWPFEETTPEWAKPSYVAPTPRAKGQAVRNAVARLEKAVREDAAMLRGCREGNRNNLLFKRAFRFFCMCIESNLDAHKPWVHAELAQAATQAGLGPKEIEAALASAAAGAESKAVRGSTPGTTRGGLTVVQGGKSLAPRQPDEDEGPSVVEVGGTEGTAAISADAFAAALGGVKAEVSPPPLVTLVSGDPLERIQLLIDRGSPARIAGNVKILLAEHPIWNGGPMSDGYSQHRIWPSPLPAPLRRARRVEREIVDEDQSIVQHWLMSLPESHRVRVGLNTAFAALQQSSSERHVDLLIDYIDSLEPWDGVPRLDTWIVKYLGCPDTLYARATGRAWLIACAERAIDRRPDGVSVDIIPVLEGPQGSGKNRMLEVLFEGGPSWAPWLSILSGHKLEKDETKRMACSRWVLHDDELRITDPKRFDDLKSWSSRLREEFRIPWAKMMTVATRRAVLIGSTNRAKYLHDDTGNRRWWPWDGKSGQIDLKSLARDRVQLLAEAVAHVRGGGHWRDGISPSIYESTLNEAEERRVDDPLMERIQRGLITGKFSKPITTQCIGEALGFSVEKIDRAFETRIGSIMKDLKYQAVRRRLKNGLRIRHYIEDGKKDDWVDLTVDPNPTRPNPVDPS